MHYICLTWKLSSLKSAIPLFLIIPDLLIKQFGFSNRVVLEVAPNGILIRKHAREGWEEQLKKAIANGELPDDELLEGFDDNIDEVFLAFTKL